MSSEKPIEFTKEKIENADKILEMLRNKSSSKTL